MASVWAAALLLRRVRAEAAILVVLFALVGSTSFLFAAAPRVLNRVTDDAIRYAVARASPIERHIRLNATGSIGPGSEGGASAMRAYGEQRELDLPTSIRGLVTDRFLGFTSVRFAVERSIIALSLRYQDGVKDATRLVSGRWPVDRGMPLQQIGVGQQSGANEGDPPTVFEAALSAAAADTIAVRVGDRLRVTFDLSDTLVPRSAFSVTPTEIEVVGVFEPLDSDADEWAGSGLPQPTFRYGPSGIEAIYATAFVAAEAYTNLHAGRVPFRYDWHFQVDPGRVDAGQAETLRTDLRRLALITSTEDNRSQQTSSSVIALTNVSFGSGLLGILDRFAAQQARSASILSIASLGPICLAGSAIGMLAVLLVRRRGSTLLLARGRGASGRLLLGAAAGEAILLTGSASLVGLLLAVQAVPARDALLSPILAFGVAGAATLLLAAATWPAARRPLIQLERDDPPVLRVSPRRLVIEATIVAVAVMAVVLLRQRGLTLGSIDSGGFDPLLAAVPLLTGLAAGIVALRLYPLAIRGLGWLAARRRDFVPVLGLRTVARHPAIANLPLLVLMLTAAFGAFASVVESSIVRGQVAASYREVGADYRLEGIGIAGLPASLDPSAIPGVDAVASGIVDPRAAYVTEDNQRATIVLDVLDVLGYRAVTAGTAADPAWPSAFMAPPLGDRIGTEANPIPAIVSSEFPPGRAELGPGDTFIVEVSGQSLTLRLVRRQAALPGFGDATNFAVVPLDWMRAAAPETSLAPTVMWLRASNDAAGPLATMADTASNPVRIVSRQDAYALIHDAPLGSAVADGFGVALGVAVLYVAITLISAVILSAAGRSRDLAYLRTLGVSTRQALALTAVEHVPAALVALLPGVLLGVAVATLAEPGLGLADFTGAQAVPLFVDWWKLGTLIVVLCGVVVLAIGAGTWLAARARLVSALRVEEG